MKTINQHLFSHPSSMDEIIFAGRNQNYGAFMLRKTSNKRVIQAFVVITIIMTPLFFIKFFNKKGPGTINREIIISTLPIERISKEAVLPPPPPPMPADLQDKLKVNTMGVPVVVDSIPEYGNPDITADPDPPYSPATGLKFIFIDTTEKDPVIDEPDRPFLKVEEEATFQRGTVGDFCKWVGKQIRFPKEAEEMQIKGKVIIQFVVNREGKIEDIKLLKGIDKLLDEEALRVIASSPVWGPARQQGIKVKQQFVIPIFFN
ncbi:MAG: energy transducer TonB [Bacteroidetes bacterium]|nr:energy transducer TonB [Bacteroidota bacterium]